MAESDRVRLLTINIWNQLGPWSERLQVLRDGLLREAADVVALQEVLRMESGGLSQLDEVGADLYPHRAYSAAWTIDQESGFTLGNAILSRLPILEEDRVMLPNPLQHETRSLLYVLIETAHGQLPLFVTHLDWQFELSHARCEQVAFIAQKIAEWRGRAQKRPGADVLPAVLLGDLNAEPDSDEIRFLRGLHSLPIPGSGFAGPRFGTYFNDCYIYCGGDEKAGVTFSRQNPYAAREHEPERRLDYIFAALPDRARRGEPLAAWRCLDQPVNGVFASDHYGMAAELRLAPCKKSDR